MTNVAKQTGLLAGTAAGCFFALATIGLEFTEKIPGMIILLMPGLLVSMGLENVTFSTWVAAMVNLVFWFLLFWLMGTLVGKALGLRKKSV